MIDKLSVIKSFCKQIYQIPDRIITELNRYLAIILLVLLTACEGTSEYDLALTAFKSGDYETASESFLPLANSGDARAQNMLGLMYERGYGVDQDFDKAASWYLKAANKGLAAAQIRIAQMYIQGRGVQRDYWEAMKWSRKAAIQGNAEAEANIAYMFHDGIDTPGL